jgi:hypothetical protein
VQYCPGGIIAVDLVEKAPAVFLDHRLAG